MYSIIEELKIYCLGSGKERIRDRYKEGWNEAGHELTERIDNLEEDIEGELSFLDFVAMCDNSKIMTHADTPFIRGWNDFLVALDEKIDEEWNRRIDRLEYKAGAVDEKMV